MIEFIIACIIILLTAVYFISTRGKQEEVVDNKKHQKAENKKSTVNIEKTTPNSNIPEAKEISIDSSKIADNKSLLLNSFREGKEMINPYISKDGKTILFHDDKRISLCYLNNFEEKNPKFLSKTVEQDVISDAAYSEDKK
jgi:hypothetical protein